MSKAQTKGWDVKAEEETLDFVTLKRAFSSRGATRSGPAVSGRTGQESKSLCFLKDEEEHLPPQMTQLQTSSVRLLETPYSQTR